MTASAAHLDHARALLAEHPIFDGHNDLPWAIRMHPDAPGDVAAYGLDRRAPGQTDLERLRAGGVGAQFWSVYVPAAPHGEGRSFAALQLEQIQLARRMIASFPEALAFCRTADEVEAAMAAGRVASLLGMEGGHVIEGSLDVLGAFRELGAAYLTLTHSRTTDWADACTDAPRHDGLSPFGREVVREMNRLGMLVDCSHVSPATMAAALDVTTAPVIFSHSSARAVCDHVRNVPDAILERLPANGGVCMVTFVASFISPATAAAVAPAVAELDRLTFEVTDPRELRRLRAELMAGLDIPLPGVAEVADHVDHVARVAGHDHVGIGGDFDGSLLFPVGLADVAAYPHLWAELIARGWTDAQLAALANGNVLRVMRAAEAVAAAGVAA
ncbi:MAG TPA: dipeptidase [Candidatus Limnocylindria bacterium]|nr:dipeptidase [Candidatus Limnocylindria bacterium]